MIPCSEHDNQFLITPNAASTSIARMLGTPKANLDRFVMGFDPSPSPGTPLALRSVSFFITLPFSSPPVKNGHQNKVDRRSGDFPERNDSPQNVALGVRVSVWKPLAGVASLPSACRFSRAINNPDGGSSTHGSSTLYGTRKMGQPDST